MPFLTPSAAIAAFLAVLCLVVPATGVAVDPPAEQPGDYDSANAREIMELCAGCHGDNGQGGGGGEYPRLAGLPAAYITAQMLQFRSGTRASMAMAPYADERELSDSDLADISRYLADIELLTRMPAIDPDLDSYEKLLIASRVFNVARVDGDTERGRVVYERECRKCHGESGVGRGKNPPLAGQYTDYLRLQIEEFRQERRANKPMLRALQDLTAADIEALLAYLATTDD
ncbi:cytochrome c [bacterium]|nr:cytochrome c [bacterium]